MRKTYLKTLLAALLLLCSTIATAHDFEVDGIFYNILSSTDKTVAVTYDGNSNNYEEYSGAVTIPASITYNSTTYSITTIGDDAFNGCRSLTSVTIPNSVTTIGDYAFHWCRSLTSVTIPNSVTTIGDNAFYQCNGLKSLTIPNSVTTIGDNAFYQCNGLTNITIPNSVTTIGNNAFSSCTNLTSITIPNSVTTIGDGAFSYCYSLASIKTESGNTKYDSRENCNAIIETETNTLIAGCRNTVIPNSVTTIGNNAFSGCINLASITIPGSVTTIGDNAFYFCIDLTSVTIPNSVTTIADGAFSSCISLESIKTESGNTKYDSRENCNAIIETETNTLIAGCKNTVIPNSVTSIGNNAFYNTGLTSITIPNSVTTIGNNAFYYCSSLKSVTIPNSVTTIGESAFERCGNLKEVHITDLAAWYNIDFGNEYSSPLYAANTSKLYLNGEAITNIVIPDGVTELMPYAFSGCTELTSITIPSSVTTIGEGAFKGCTNLKEVYITDIAAWCNIDFANEYSCPFSATTYNDINNTTNLYLNGKAINNIVIPDGVTELKSYVFGGNTTLTSVTIPNSVTSIGHDAFSRCISLISVTIPNSVTTLGVGAFYNCSNLESITIGNGVTSIEYDAFLYCNKLNEVHITDIAAWCNIDFELDSKLSYAYCYSNPLYYANNLYLNGEKVTDLVIPEGVTIIKDYAFNRYWVLKSVTIPNSVTTIGNNAFSDCNLTNITIPNSVTTIGNEAFSGCIYLTSITISNSVTTIGNNAFYNCINLESITIPSSVTNIGEDAFLGCNGLKSIKTESGNTKYDSRENCNAIIETETNTLIVGCKNTEIPNSVTTIGNSAFRSCDFTSITIPNSVTTIGNKAFYNCDGLKSLTIPNSVTTIGNNAFSYCDNLANVTIGNGVTSIGENAFEDCEKLKEVHITDLAAWGNIDFYDYKSNPLYYAKNLYLNGNLVTSLVIPNDVTEIKAYAFYNCTELTSVTIPTSITSIGNDAFYYCSNLKNVYNFSTLNIIKGAASHGSVARYADILISILGGTAEEDFIFDENGILVAYAGNDSEVVLPANYKGGSYSIGNNAFRGNTTMESVTIPASVTSIGECAFTGCSNLTSIYAESSLPAWLASDAFAEHYKSATLHVPAGTKAAYSATTPQREDYEVTVPTTNFNDLQGTIKSCNTNASYTTVNVATQNPDVTGILYGSDYLLAYTNEKNATKMPSATFCITDTNSGRYKIALVTAPWFIESYEDTLVTSTDAPKYRKSYLRVSVSQNNELLGMFPSDSVKLRSGGYGVLATSAIVPDSARIDTIFLKNSNGRDFVFNLNHSGSIYETDLSNSIDIKVELLAPAYKRGSVYMSMNTNHHAFRFLLDQIMLVPVDDKKIISTVYWSNFTNIVEMEPDTTLGDITGDGEVNVADVTSIVAMILDPSTVTGVADITGDGEVNVADVTTLVSIILGTSNAAPARAAATRSADAPVVSAEFDEDNNMYINVSNPDYPFTAIQFDLAFEGGISVVTDGEYFDVFLGSRTTSRNHSEPECNPQPDGSLRVVILSLKNKNFTGEEGDVATVALNLDGVADGSYSYSIKNIVLSDPSSVIKYPADVEAWVNVAGGVTGIDSIAADGENANEAIYDLSGRKVANPVKGGIYIKGGKKIIM